MGGGGAEHVASILLNHLCKNNDTYVALNSTSFFDYPLNKRIHIIENNTNSYFKGTVRLPRYIKMIRTIKDVNPDLIISFITKTNNNALFANLFFRKKIIISERNTLNSTSSKTQRIIRKLLYPFADKIVFVTTEDYYKSKLQKKSLVIHNPSMLKPNNNYNDRKKSIVTIAPDNRWYQKGLDLLICAWDRIATQYPDWNLEIYGRIYGVSLPESITRQKQERVFWKGWTDNIDNVLKTKSIFILASRFEGCPNSLIEAMSQGCACIVTDCEGEQKLMIDNGANGLIARNEDINDIAQKLQILIDDEELRRKYSAKAIEKSKLFDKNSFFAEWDNLIYEVIK